jgi:glycosyltransferase involved in cell wall biosynthesis
VQEHDRILVFVPVYNCAPQISRVLEQLAEERVRSRFSAILVLDNISADGTVAAAQAAKARFGLSHVMVARNRENYGLGGSHKAAFAYAAHEGYTHVVVLHGDDQGHIEDLLPVLDAGAHRTHDACLGSRFARTARLKGYSRFRIFGNYVFNALFTMGTQRLVSDLGSGLNIFARAAFLQPRLMTYSDDLRFNVFLLVGAFDLKWKIMFFPISWREDDQVSNVKMASQAMRTLSILRDYVLRRERLRQRDHRTVARAAYVFDILDDDVSGSVVPQAEATTS